MAKDGLGYRYGDVFLLDGVRTPFVDYCGALAAVSPIDLGIKAARALFARAEVPPAHVGQVIAGSMAQASFDAYMLPRHIGLYAGVPIETPSILVQRVCGTGFELIAQAGDILTLGKAELALCVGTESMSRNPVAAYTHRTGFRLGQVEFKDFLWEALLDPAAQCTMGQTAENLARKYELARDEVDAFAASSFARALAAQQEGFLAGEIVPVASESFERDGMSPRAIKLDRAVKEVAQDSHIRPTPPEVLAKLKPAFGGVQTGGNSSAIVDGAAAVVVANKDFGGAKPLARIVAQALVGAEPYYHLDGPVQATQRLLERTGMAIGDIDLFEVNEAFASVPMSWMAVHQPDPDRVNVNGGAIAIGHPVGSTGSRLITTALHELERRDGTTALITMCAGGALSTGTIIERI